MPFFCEAGHDSYTNRCLSSLHTFLPVKVYPEEIPDTVELWFDKMMEKWMTLDLPKGWESKSLVPLIESVLINLPGYINVSKEPNLIFIKLTH